jgi:signal transduction histidine kinase
MQHLLSGARVRRGLTFVAGAVLLAVVGIGDLWTGPDLPFSLFYLVPVCLITWREGKWAGSLMALASAAVSLWVDIAGARPYSHPLYAFLNAAITLIFFHVVVALLSAWKGFGARLTRMVEQRTAELRQQIAHREQAADRIKKLAAELSQAEASERRRIAYDVHDSLGQMLTLLKLNLETLAATAQPQPNFSSRLTDTLKIVEELIEQTRALTFDLHPAMLDDLGLAQTLRWYATQFEGRANVEVTVSEHGQRRQLPQTVSSYLFRAVKELLNNAVKHGRAREIVMGLHWEGTMLRLVVDDDGAGFQPAETLPASHRGLGLAGIRERLASFGGAVRLETGDGQGTRVILEAPLE